MNVSGILQRLIVLHPDAVDAGEFAKHFAQFCAQKVLFDGVVNLPQVDSLQKNPVAIVIYPFGEGFISLSSARNSVATHLLHGFVDSGAHVLQLVGREKVFDYAPSLMLAGIDLFGSHCRLYLASLNFHIIEDGRSTTSAQAAQLIYPCGSGPDSFLKRNKVF